jgi:hypothetical protein
VPDTGLEVAGEHRGVNAPPGQLCLLGESDIGAVALVSRLKDAGLTKFPGVVGIRWSPFTAMLIVLTIDGSTQAIKARPASAKSLFMRNYAHTCW